MTAQIPLSIHLNTQHGFDNFFWGNNQILQRTLHQLLSGEERFLYMWGESGVGKTHLLQACCQHENSHHRPAMYLPLRCLQQQGPEMLEGIEQFQLVAVDDIDAVAGHTDWEESFFHLYNRIRDDRQTRLIISAKQSPTLISIQLPDLRSRLSWGLSLPVNPLTDDQKVKVIQKIAWEMGIELSDKVLQYLMVRSSRNMHDLIALLNQLDKASLAAKRKITVPFVKQELDI